MIQTTQYNKGKQNLKIQIGDVENKIPDVTSSVYKNW